MGDRNKKRVLKNERGQKRNVVLAYNERLYVKCSETEFYIQGVSYWRIKYSRSLINEIT